MMKPKKLIILGLLAGAALLPATGAYALDDRDQLERQIRTLEAQFTSASLNDPNRVELVREIRENRAALDELQRADAERRREEMRRPAENRIIERQARILEESERFLPEEIALMRNNPVIERLDTDAIEEKSVLDLSFKEAVEQINEQIAVQQRQLDALKEQRKLLIKDYRADIADLAEREDLPFVPVNTPAPAVLPSEVSVSPGDNRAPRSGGISIGGGGVSTDHLATDFHAH